MGGGLWVAAGVYSLRVDFQFEAATDLDPPDPDRPGWKKIFASSINFELLTSPGNGFGAQAQGEFLMQPLNGRWYIAEFSHLPRP